MSSSFDPDLRLARTELFHNILKITSLLFAIQITKQFPIKSCLRWLPGTLHQSQVMLCPNHGQQKHGFLNLKESQDERSIEETTTFCSPNINEASFQVKCENKIYRSRIDIYVNLRKNNIRRRRSRAVSRIPTAQIKRVMIKVQKHIRKVVPQSSKLHVYLSRKSSALFRRLNNEFFTISDHKHKSAKKQRLNFSRKYYQSRYHCCTKLENLFAFCTNKNLKTQEVCCLCLY